MENNNTEILSVLNEINENIKLVLEEFKKSNENKMKNAPNLFDIFGGMNSPDEDEEDEEEEEDEDEAEEEEEDEEEEEEEEAEEEADTTK
tara:strand:+ start:415 stop:684 length:270 start_codon:yes stop_codon:yes gene_type:complete